jgi:hypothetical protein
MRAVRPNIVRHAGFLACVWAALITAGCYRARPTEIILIPKGFTGWIRIDYGVPGSPPVKKNWGEYLVPIPWSGRLSTSTPLGEGLAEDKYYEVDQSGRRQLIQVEYDGGRPGRGVRSVSLGGIVCEPGKGQIDSRVFFVGTAAEYQKNSTDQSPAISGRDCRVPHP